MPKAAFQAVGIEAVRAAGFRVRGYNWPPLVVEDEEAIAALRVEANCTTRPVIREVPVSTEALPVAAESDKEEDVAVEEEAAPDVHQPPEPPTAPVRRTRRTTKKK